MQFSIVALILGVLLPSYGQDQLIIPPKAINQATSETVHGPSSTVSSKSSPAVTTPTPPAEVPSKTADSGATKPFNPFFSGTQKPVANKPPLPAAKTPASPSNTVDAPPKFVPLPELPPGLQGAGSQDSPVDAPVVCHVIQVPFNAKLTASETEAVIRFTTDSGKACLTAVSADADWVDVQLNRDGGTVTLDVSANNDSAPRSTTVYVVASKQSFTYKIKQAGSPKSLNATPSPETVVAPESVAKTNVEPIEKLKEPVRPQAKELLPSAVSEPETVSPN